MHDKMNNEETLENLVDNLNDYFDLDSLNIEDLSKCISECNLDSEK